VLQLADQALLLLVVVLLLLVVVVVVVVGVHTRAYGSPWCSSSS
jgi:hypothetical protein